MNKTIENILDTIFVINSLLVIILFIIVFISLFGFFDFVNNNFLIKYSIILLAYWIQAYLIKKRT